MASILRTRAVAWLPESAAHASARAAFDNGVTAEIQAALAGPISGPVPKRLPLVSPEALSALREAARQYETALSYDPAYAAAALHLGRSRLLDGQDADADRWLRVASAARARPVSYLALMFRGALAERQGRFTDAEALYRSAGDVFPWAQSAPLVLSQLCMRSGREQEAREAVASHFARTRERVVEPLWTYLADPSADLGRTLDELRAEVWR